MEITTLCLDVMHEYDMRGCQAKQKNWDLKSSGAEKTSGIIAVAALCD